MVRHRQCGQQRQPHRRTDRRAVERHQWWLRRVTGGQHMGGAEGRLDVGLLDGHRRQCDRLVVQPAVFRPRRVGLEPRLTCRHAVTMARNAARSPVERSPGTPRRKRSPPIRATWRPRWPASRCRKWSRRKLPTTHRHQIPAAAATGFRGGGGCCSSSLRCLHWGRGWRCGIGDVATWRSSSSRMKLSLGRRTMPTSSPSVHMPPRRLDSDRQAVRITVCPPGRADGASAPRPSSTPRARTRRPGR